MKSYLLKLFHDELAPNSEVTPGLESQHTITYVWKGSATVNGELIEADSAVYSEDFAAIKAGPEGAVLWRWELVPEGDPLHLLPGKGVNSILRMARKIRMFELVPTSKWLFRLDCIIDNQGSTGLHSHPGSGIRLYVEWPTARSVGQRRIFRQLPAGRCLVRGRQLPAGIHYRRGLEGNFPAWYGAAAGIRQIPRYSSLDRRCQVLQERLEMLCPEGHHLTII